MTNKIIQKNYYLKNKKIKEKIKILLISDIHISNIFKIEKLNKIIEKVKENNPHYICIPGDLIDCTNILDEKYYEDLIIDFLKQLGHLSKVIISLGNHDISRLIKTKNCKWKKEIKEKFYQKLNNIKNVYLLDNDIYNDKNISFIGFTPSYKYYKETDENKELLIEEMNNQMLNFSKSKYNVLLCHTPIHMLDEEILEKGHLMKNVDLILSGHMHNGMVPPILDKIWKSNSGIITPSKKLYPKAKLTRGIKNVNNKTLIISGGITKLSSSSPNVLHPFNDLFPMNIELININN